MSIDIERRLVETAAEIRRVSRVAPPPPAEPAATAWRGPMVMAGSFAAVLVLVASVLFLLPERNPSPDAAVAPPGSLESTTVTGSSTGPTTAPAGQCSASGMTTPPVPGDLPPGVAAVHRGIVAAAVACDFASLQRFAGERFVSSFGGGDFHLLVEWEEAGEPALRRLVTIMGLPHAVQTLEDGLVLYVWPSAFIYDEWEEIPVEDLDALLQLYTPEELEQLSAFGSYAGWRVGIDGEGEWRFFVAGD